jgi:hypothetical protein
MCDTTVLSSRTPRRIHIAFFTVTPAGAQRRHREDPGEAQAAATERSLWTHPPTPSRIPAKRPPTRCSSTSSRTIAPRNALSLLAALTAAVLLLVGTCLQLCEAGGVEEGTLLRQTLAGLKQRVRTRPAWVPLPLLAEPDDAEPQDPRVRHQTEALSRVLATLLGDAEEAHQLSREGRWRIARALVADLLCLWLPPGDLPEVVVDAVMAQLGWAVAAQLGRARGQPVPSQPGRFGAGTREA